MLQDRKVAASSADHPTVSSNDYISFPFQTLAPGVWLLSFKENVRAQRAICCMQWALHSPVGWCRAELHGEWTSPCWDSSSSPPDGEGHSMDLILWWYLSGEVFFQCSLLHTCCKGKLLALVVLIIKSCCNHFRNPLWSSSFINDNFGHCASQGYRLEPVFRWGLGQEASLLYRKLGHGTPHPETGWSSWPLPVPWIERETQLTYIHRRTRTDAHTHTHTYARAHTHTSLTLPAPLYLGVREAGYLKARGEYSISCLIWDISLPVLTITKGFILGGKFISETVRLGGPIYSQRERVCVKGGKPSLTLSKRLHNLIGSPFPWDL